MQKNSHDKSLIEALKDLLLTGEASTQEHICSVMEKAGYEINQSKVSRLLRKIGAIKVENAKGQTVYSLPREPAPPTSSTQLCNLVLDVDCNETMVVIMTSPGSASMIARMLDYASIKHEILGTVAGDDTIFVSPKYIKNTKALTEEIKKLLGF